MKTLAALVGMKYRNAKAFVASLPQGEPLTLVREPTNSHDRNAVQVHARGQHVGYVKGNQASPIALAMDSAKIGRTDDQTPIRATLAIDGGKWPMVEIDDGRP